jgi:hypothetical protein
MPVLSEPQHHAAQLSSPLYVFFAAILFLSLGTLLTRSQRRSSQTVPPPPPSPSSPSLLNEKQPLLPPSQTHSPPTSEYQPPLPLPPPLNNSIPPLPSSHPAFFDPSSAASTDLPPRRRSYTKTTPTGTEVSGEILVAEGWRRHTRVFGGGVCIACQESERRLSA